MSPEMTCPTCGAAVRVVQDSESTAHYEVVTVTEGDGRRRTDVVVSQEGHNPAAAEDKP